MALNNLKEILSHNIKKERKKFGFTQEKLAEIAELSSQTINDIEGCRMWVSDKTMSKLANVLQIEAYQLLIPIATDESTEPTNSINRKLLLNLEEKIIKNIKQQFTETIKFPQIKKN